MKERSSVDITSTINHISLCTGYGGIDIGLSRVIRGLRTIAYVEIESFAVINLVKKIEGGWIDPAPIYSNLKTFPYDQFCGRVDIISGGFPCQPFSSAGRRRGDEDPRHLFPYILRGAQTGRVPILFLENVLGILSSTLQSDGWNDPKGTPVLLHVLRELERGGYRSAWGVFSAEECGAPHQRKRIFILAVSDRLSRSGYDEITRRAGIELDNPIESRSLRTIRGREPLREVTRSSKETAYPKGRGVDQYEWEPNRTTMADNLNTTTGREVGDAERQGGGALVRSREELPTERNIEHSRIKTVYTAYPKGRGIDQYEWEPNRVQIKSEMGGNIDGSSDRMDKADLFDAYDNRADELRLLGNGVVPDTAARAFQVLWEKLENCTGERWRR